MNEEQRNRAILRSLEDDWRAALVTMNEVRRKERRETQDALAAIHRGYRRLGWGLVGVLVAGIAVVVIGFFIITGQADTIEQQTQRLADIQTGQQASRKRAVLDACVERNRLAGGNLFFVQKVAPKLLPLARRVFRYQASCEAYTRAVLVNRTPPPTVPGQPLPPHR